MTNLKRTSRYLSKNLLGRNRVDSILQKKHSRTRALERVFKEIDLLEIQVYSPQ